MKAWLLLLCLIPLLAFSDDSIVTGTAQEKASEAVKPYDRLGRDNVTIRAQHKGGGGSSDYDYKASWGSYARTVTSTKDIEVTITQPRREKQPLKLEFFFVIRGDSKR
jgi:hypothetical protein